MSLAAASDAAPIIKGLYRHYKGNYYQVLGEVIHSETLETMVLYKALYGKRELWVRPKAMFMETVVCEGQEMPRFAYVGKNNSESQ